MAHLNAWGWLLNTGKMQGPGLDTEYQHTLNHPTLNNYRSKALEMLTQGQICELDMASHLEGFGWNLWQQQNNIAICGLVGIGLERDL